MTDGTIGVDEPGTIDLNLDTEDLGGTPPKHRERVQVAGAVLAEIARVLNADPALTDYGLFVRNRPHGVISPNETGNSSVIPLGISGVFTGTGEDVKDYATITLLVKSDEASATDGLSLEYSPDGTNWDDNDKYTVSADSAKALTLWPEGRFFRVVYTNGGTAQTFFRLQVIYHYHRTKPSSHRIGDLAAVDIAENDAELVFGVVVGNEVHDAPDSQGPVKIVGKASTSTPAAVAASDRVDAYFDEFGRLAIFDGGASVTVDAPVATPIAARLSDGAAFYDTVMDTQLPAALVSGRLDVNLGAAGAGVKIEAVGDLDHDVPNAAGNNPQMAGLEAVAHGAAPTAVDAADVTKWYANRHGIPFVIGGHMNTFRVPRKDTAAQTNVILQAVAGGEKAVITAISVYLGNDVTVDVQALIEFDAGSTISEHPNLAAGSGFVEGNGGGILAIGGDGQDVLWTCTVPTTGAVTVQVSGYLVPS